MKLSEKQKEHIGKFLLDISKIILAVFVIVGLLPESRITGLQIFIAIMEAIVIFVGGLFFFKEETMVNTILIILGVIAVLSILFGVWVSQSGKQKDKS